MRNRKGYKTERISIAKQISGKNYEQTIIKRSD